MINQPCGIKTILSETSRSECWTCILSSCKKNFRICPRHEKKKKIPAVKITLTSATELPRLTSNRQKNRRIGRYNQLKKKPVQSE